MDDAGTHRLIRSAVSRTGQAWLALVDATRTANPVDQLETRLHYPAPLGDTTPAARQFAAAVHGVYLTAGQQEARYLGAELDRAPVAKKLVTFDASDPDALAWAEQNAADLIREITAEQRQLIQAALAAGRQASANPRVVAKLIQDSIGLTEYQMERVASYRRALESGDLSRALDAELRDGRFDRSLQAAIDAGNVIPPARIDAMVDRYRAAWVRSRAEMIARTEGLRAAHQGSEALFKQAVSRGTIAATRVERKWLHTPGPHKRKGHAAMQGQLRGMGEAFETPAGVALSYPCDPNAPAAETIGCRCAVATRLKPA